MTRLSPALSSEQRHDLSIALAAIALSAISGTSMDPAVVTSDPEVASWAKGEGVDIVADSGGGLSASVEAAVGQRIHTDWVVLHADLPFVTSAALETFLAAADGSGSALAPSVDGGTNAIAASGLFRFSYGPDSFHRHLARLHSAAVVSRPELAIEIDTEAHLSAVRSRPLPSSLPL